MARKVRPDGTVRDEEAAMIPDLFWIPGPWSGKLAVSSRPRGGDWLDDETAGWRDAGVDVVVSLLERDEAGQLGLEYESETVESRGLQFLSFPIPDRGVPESIENFVTILNRITALLAGGKNVAVHCRQSVGHAGLVAAASLMMFGVGMNDAIEAVSHARGVRIPETSGQLEWLRHLASESLALASR